MLRIIYLVFFAVICSPVAFADVSSVTIGSNCEPHEHKVFFTSSPPQSEAEAGAYFIERMSKSELEALHSPTFVDKGAYRTTHELECLAEFIDGEWIESDFARKVRRDLKKNGLVGMPWASYAILYSARDPIRSSAWIAWLRAIKERDSLDETMVLPAPSACNQNDAANQVATVILDGNLGWQSMRSLHFCQGKQEQKRTFMFAWERGWFEPSADVLDQLRASNRIK